ncbi:MAG: HAD family hydrolase [Velocimicrobium sp.]
MVKAVIFDMDGVLIDTEKHLVKYWCQAAREYGFDMKREHAIAIRSLASKYAAPYLQEIFGETFDYEHIRTRRKELMQLELSRSGIEKKPEVDFILEKLRERNIKTAVATATDEIRAKKYLSEIGIYHKFDQIICATMVENGKPMPDIYQYACDVIHESAADCIAVEDSPNGVLSATRAGIRTIMVPDLTQPDKELQSLLYGVVEKVGGILSYI